MSAAAEPIILFDQVNKWYGDNFHVLRDIDLQVKQGERIVICGPSGSGKSTLIRCVNRLEEHQQGRLVVDGTELTDDVKAKIFGLNSAALYGIDPITGPCELSATEVENIRASLPPARTYGPTTYAESAAMIAAHQGGYLL